MRFKIIFYVKDDVNPLFAFSDDIEAADIICDSIQNYYGLGNDDVWIVDYAEEDIC